MKSVKTSGHKYELNIEWADKMVLEHLQQMMKTQTSCHIWHLKAKYRAPDDVSKRKHPKILQHAVKFATGDAIYITKGVLCHINDPAHAAPTVTLSPSPHVTALCRVVLFSIGALAIAATRRCRSSLVAPRRVIHPLPEKKLIFVAAVAHSWVVPRCRRVMSR
jgi:hypothetical protein